MAISTKILILEHDPVDLELLENELQKGGLNYVSHVVQNEKDYTKAFSAFAPDIILADYTFPSFDGPTAFKIRKELAPDIPFIFVSGTIGEERSIELIKNGLTDYALKDKLFTLNTKIKRALKEASEIKLKAISNRELVQSEQQYRQIVETAQEGIWLTDENNSTILVNKKMADILDSSPAEMTGKSSHQFMDEEWKEKEIAYAAIRKKGVSQKHDFKYITRKGITVWTNLSINPVFDSAGIYRGTLSMVTDITEQRASTAKIKKNEQLYQTLFEQNLAGIFQTSLDGRVLNCNTAFWKMLKYDSKKELLETNAVDLYFSEQDRSNFIADLVAQEVLSDYDVTLKCKDGSSINVIENISLRRDEATGEQFCHGMLVDITARKKAEREISWLINNTEESFILLNTRLEIVSFNNQAQLLYTKYLLKNLIKGDSILDYVQPHRYSIVTKIYERVLLGAEEMAEISIPRPDGATKYFSLKYKPAKDEQGEVIGVFVSVIDITENKKSQRLLIVQEKRYKSLVENGADAVAIISPAGKILYVSPTIQGILGYTEEEVMKLDIFSLCHADDIPEMTKVWQRVLASPGEAIPGHTSRMQHKDGSWRWLEATVTNMIHEPALNGIVDNFRDVTEKIEAERLREFERRDKEALINTTTDLIWSISSDFRLIAANKAFFSSLLDFTGIKLEPGDQLLMNEKFDPAYLNYWKDVYTKALMGQPFSTEIHTPAARHYPQKWSETSFNPIFDGDTITGIACYSRDTTDAKNFQNTLVDINKKLETAQQIASLGYWELDMITDTMYWSNEVYHIWGVTKDSFQVNFRNIYATIHPQDRKIFHEILKTAQNGNGKTDIEHRVIMADGKVKCVHEKGELVFNKEGIAIRFEGTVQDITKRKNAEGEMKQLTSRLLLATTSAGLGIWEWDIKENKLEWDEGMYKLYGVSTLGSGSTYKEWISMLHPEDRSRVNDEMQQAIEGRKEYNTEFRIIRKDQSLLYIKATGIRETDTDGKPTRVIGTNLDITLHKQKEQQLKLLESVITNTTDSVLITEAEPVEGTGLRIVYANQAFTNMTGYTAEEVMGKSPAILQGPESDKKELDRLREAISKWQPCEITIINYKKNGEQFWINFSISPVANSEGWFTHWIAIERDITERKTSEIRLNNLNRDLQAQAKELAFSNAELEQFAYVASHDLQEPLRMVTSFLMLLEKKYGDIIDDKGKTYIKFAVDGAKRMRQIILDLLEFSRVGTTEDKLENVNLNKLIEELKILFKKQTAGKDAFIHSELLPVIHAYKTPLRQVFQNLVSNALKYHRPGIAPQIEIAVTELKDHWQISIADNGIGIETEYFDKIFIIFQRLHNKDEFSGTGMGLAITKKIIESQGGKIWVTSEEGKGSTFYFTLSKFL